MRWRLRSATLFLVAYTLNFSILMLLAAVWGATCDTILIDCTLAAEGILPAQKAGFIGALNAMPCSKIAAAALAENRAGSCAWTAEAAESMHTVLTNAALMMWFVLFSSVF